MKSLLSTGAATIAMVFSVPQGVAAQGTPVSVNLRGTVVDQTQAAVPGADVVIYREGTSIAHVKTNSDGQFSFYAPAQAYQVMVRAPGFADLRSTPVPFKVESTSQFTLQVEPTDRSGVVVSTRQEPASESRSDGLQESPVREVAGTHPWTFGVLAEGGVGTNDRSNFKFFSLGGHAGKVLTPNVGSGLLQGNFEYGVEVFPLWQSYTPHFQRISCDTLPVPVGQSNCSQPYTVGGTYTGVSIVPIQLRWNFTHGERWMPWLQGAGGVVWTNHKYPAVGNTDPTDFASNGPNGDTSVWNFTPQFGVGTHYFLRPRRSLDFSANAVHISSASLGDKNPGVNASVMFTVGYSWWK